MQRQNRKLDMIRRSEVIPLVTLNIRCAKDNFSPLLEGKKSEFYY